MPDLNKQTLVNLLIDSPLREPIKINLIDIVNNTKDNDLSKTYSTIQKELEIYQKATNRRIKLADEINKKLGDSPMQQTQNDQNTNPPVSNKPSTTPPKPTSEKPTSEPTPTDASPIETSAPKIDKPAADQKGPDLPPPTKLPPVDDDAPDVPSTIPDPTQTPTTPSPTQDQAAPPPPPPPTTPTPPTPTDNGTLGDVSEDEQALAEIQKELDTLKNSAAEDAGTTETPQPVESAPQPETKPQE